MTLLIDDISEPGAWIRAIGRGCLSETAPICRACGKPFCDHPDPVFCGVLPDQSARNSEPEDLRGIGERRGVHVDLNTDTGAQHHVC